jgi:DNA phosphorothioation system restriction enzyme
MVQHDSERFERLWCDEDPNVRVYDLPEAAREHILKLRTEERPYPAPKQIEEHEETYTIPPQPHLPSDLHLRDYQEEAIRAWFEHDCQGMLEMATGTGKTITALAASVRLYERERRLAVNIAVPYQHLVDQWNDEAIAFGYQPVLVYQSKTRWQDDVNSQVMELNAGYRKHIAFIVTHATFASPAFQHSIARLQQPALLVADEAHHLGAERSQQSYPEHILCRLALSATPDRWFDDAGTAALRDYFGETVFSFPLEKAIGVSLTPYYYYPHLVPLTDDELDRYEELSVKIARLAAGQKDDGDVNEALKMLLFRRADLLNKAENKLMALDELVDQQPDIAYALFYCAPGQIDEVLRLLGWEKGLLVHRFTAEEDARERQRLLKRFAEQELQGLVAMKCLDEGVDVPSTRTAFFLASSSNPREFIQRRGRILRKAPGKDFSVIHDLIAVPPTRASLASATFQTERGIMRRELERFKEFANLAQNKHEALDVVWDLARHYGLMDF